MNIFKNILAILSLRKYSNNVSGNKGNRGGSIFEWWIDYRQSKKDRLEFLKSEDWYYRTSWLNKNLFKFKLKRFIMNFIYKLIKEPNEKYFIEFGFYSPKSNKLDEYNKKNGTYHSGDFKFYLPLIVEVKNRTQALYIATQINKALINEYKIENIFHINVSTLPLTQESLNAKIDLLNRKFKLGTKTTLEINTYKPDYNGEYDLENPEITITDIEVIKAGTITFLNQFNFIVKIIKTTVDEK